MANREEVLRRAIHTGAFVSNLLLNSNRVPKAIELSKECLILLNSKALQKDQGFVRVFSIWVYTQIFKAYDLICDHVSVIACGRKLLVLLRECGQKEEEAPLSIRLAQLYIFQCQHEKAKDHCMKALCIMKETGKWKGKGECYGNLGPVFLYLGEYVKAKECLQNALKIREEIGDKHGEAADCDNLGAVFLYLGEYVKAEEYLQRALQISKEIGYRQGEARAYGNLGTVFESLSKYAKAKECLQGALQISKEIGDRSGEATAYGNLGNVFSSLGDYVKAEKYIQKALSITKEIGDKNKEGSFSGNLGALFCSIGEYVKSEKYLQEALVIARKFGDKKEEASCCENLGTLFQPLGKYVMAEEYLQNALVINRAIGNKDGEASCYGNLGAVFQFLGRYVKAEEYHLKALHIRKKICNRSGEASSYEHLGSVFHNVGEFVKAEKHHHRALQIRTEIGDRGGQASSYTSLGTVFQSLGVCAKAEECHQKALEINKEIGDKMGEALCYGDLGTLHIFLGKYVKAEEYLQKALQIVTEIGHKAEEATSYGNLGTVFFCIGEHSKAKNYYETALALSYEIGSIELQFGNHLNLTWVNLVLEGDINDAMKSLHLCITKSEEIRGFLRDNDVFKISFLDEHVSPYELLTRLFCGTGKHIEGLHVVELGRARALGDIMSSEYCVEQQISVNPKSWAGIETIMTKESNCDCLYFFYHCDYLFLWIIKPNKAILFRQIDINDFFVNKQTERSVDKVLGGEKFRKFHVLPSQEFCEDRSLFPSQANCLAPNSPQENGPAASRLLEEDEDENQDGPLTFAQCYKMIIAPVADLLDKPEIIIVPYRALYKVPFAALKDEDEKYLSETFRIRIVPSLTILKLIQDSPADYHSQTGALIVGEPRIGDVYDKGRLEKLCPLPAAKEEAEMIGRLLGVQPLLGEHATKQAVLQSIHSVSLIHVAAHGDAERGEIALAPPRCFEGIPQEQDYLLTMAEVSQVRLRAKLVVLSCCHSARGQIRSEGVIGIARAFLGSGARSVLVALWALEDKATEQFMSCFYEHLVRGESASDSLDQTMKWMRANGFSEERQWAPFMLIGDNVTFDFRN